MATKQMSSPSESKWAVQPHSATVSRPAPPTARTALRPLSACSSAGPGRVFDWGSGVQAGFSEPQAQAYLGGEQACRLLGTALGH